MTKRYFPPGDIKSKDLNSLSVWRIFSFGLLILQTGILGLLSINMCRKIDVLNKLRDSPRKRMRALCLLSGFWP
jgi:hypothetical protein